MEPIGRQLVWAAKSVRRHFESHLAGAGGTLPTWGILSAIELFQWKTQHELARSLQIEGATLTRQLDRLEHEGLVRRVRGDGDRRAIRVETTPQGRESYLRLLEAAKQADAEIRALLSPEELESLQAILGKLQRGLAVGSDEPSA